MNKLDLEVLLKGQEGKTFWSPVFGNLELLEIHERKMGRIYLRFRTPTGECRNLTPWGSIGYNYSGCIVWPSSENQTWDGYRPPSGKEPCGTCREFNLISGNCGVCKYSEDWIHPDTPGCLHHRLTDTLILQRLRERLEEEETNKNPNTICLTRELQEILNS